VNAAADHYADSAEGWDAAASRVYGPLAVALVARSPHPLAGRLVLDAGAGTGFGSSALAAAGARVVATDLSAGMLLHRSRQRPPSAVADIARLPLAERSVDDAIAPFVLNHLAEPVAALSELGRVVRAGGAVLATVFANSSSSLARDRVDEVAARLGFAVPSWYRELKATHAAAVGTPDALVAVAVAAGLDAPRVEQARVDVGVLRADDLVDYRLSQAQYTPWMATLTADQRSEVRRSAIAAAAPVMQPYRPTVLFLVATVPL
jgi:SAM-dependent methyltransferase